MDAFTTRSLRKRTAFITVSDNQKASTVGLLSGPTSPLESHIERDERRYSLTVNEFTVGVGETAEWNLFFTAHEGGSVATEQAQQLADRAEEFVGSLPQSVRQFDQNNNNQIDSIEVLDVIRSYSTQTTIDGKQVSFQDVLTTIRSFNSS